VPVFLALSGLGWAAAHALAHQTVMSEPAAASTPLDGYLSYLTTSFALCFALALPLAAGAMVGRRWHGSSLRSLWLFAVVPVLGFSGHTVAEPLVGAPGPSWSVSAVVSIVLVGLLVQVPFALVAVGLARRVLWFAEGLARSLARPGQVRAPHPVDRYPRPHLRHAPRVRIDPAHLQRGPPLLPA
jgi:hypothetical protein